jgi:NAD(P)H-binding
MRKCCARPSKAGMPLSAHSAHLRAPFVRVTLLSTATRALISAIKAEGNLRLVAITGMGAGDSAGHGGFVFDKLIFPLLLRKVYADKNRQEAIIKDGGLDWTIVRPSILNNEAGRGAIRTLTDLSDFHGGAIARQDVASFVGSVTFCGASKLRGLQFALFVAIPDKT